MLLYQELFLLTQSLIMVQQQKKTIWEIIGQLIRFRNLTLHKARTYNTHFQHELKHQK